MLAYAKNGHLVFFVAIVRIIGMIFGSLVGNDLAAVHASFSVIPALVLHRDHGMALGTLVVFVNFLALHNVFVAFRLNAVT